jgi:hypothetical protein
VSVSAGALSLTNCTFTDNEGMFGGALALDSSAALFSGGPMGLAGRWAAGAWGWRAGERALW